jgi:CHASE3 domain sensor protein
MSNNNSKRTVYLAVILLLLIINGIGAYFLLKGQKENDTLTTEITELRDDYSELQADFNRQLAELNQMKGQNEQLDSIIKVREAEIKAHLAEIEKWKKQSSVTAAELKKTKDLIAAFEKEKIVFRATLDSLFAANDELKMIKENLESDLASEKKTTEQLSKEKKYLGEKFEIGSLLMADELYASGIKVKDNGAEKEVSKIKNADKIMVCYQTGANKVREPGIVVMHLRLISPDGETMYLEVEGSGTFVNKENGEKMRFTKEAKFEYDNTNKKVCIYWSHNITKAGEYTAEIYQDGYLVGSTVFSLK